MSDHWAERVGELNRRIHELEFERDELKRERDEARRDVMRLMGFTPPRAGRYRIRTRHRRRAVPGGGAMKKITVDVLKDADDPSVICIAVNDIRITPSKGSGLWDVVKSWTIPADRIVEAMRRPMMMTSNTPDPELANEAEAASLTPTQEDELFTAITARARYTNWIDSSRYQTDILIHLARRFAAVNPMEFAKAFRRSVKKAGS